MARRRLLLRMLGWTCVLFSWALAGPVLHAQDRGAPRFGPSTPTDTIEAEASDAGRLWSLAAPPFKRFEKRYGVKADSAWATHLRRGLLRLPQCTAALVSPHGLALTSAECVRKALQAQDEAPVVAQKRADERALPGLHADRLVGAAKVTAQVQAARRDTAVQRPVATVQQRLQDEAGPNRRVKVQATAGGAPYTAYTYRRYDDVRLAFLPELALSDFGGLAAAMTYPRQMLDAALLRVYTSQGTPLTPEHYFETTTQGVRPGDAVFSVGHPGATRRAESADQLAVRRDLVLPNREALLESWTRAFRRGKDSTGKGTKGRGRSLKEAARTLKRSRARLEALESDYVMTRLRRRDAHLRDALRRDSTLRRRFGGILDSLRALQAAKRKLAPEYRAFGVFGAESYISSTFRRILHAVRPSSPGDSLSGPRWSAPVETALLADRLHRIKELLRPDTAAIKRLLNDRSPEKRAAVIVEESVLASAGTGPQALSAVPTDDPAAALLDLVVPRARSFYQTWGRLSRAERRLTRRLARARQAVQSTPVVRAQQRTPRLTDGRVLGYSYNGTRTPPFTTFYGLYGRSRAVEKEGAWVLPARWKQAAPTPIGGQSDRVVSGLDRSTPLTLAASTDPVAATRGAPLLNKYLEIVGVVAGPNIQAVAGEYLFLPERMRTVAVDLRGLRESLRSVYGADRLVDELAGSSSGPSEPSR
ncbi:MAG: S46 family peptidase [Salinibacter sp.]